jgi:hypothetical protein
LRVIAEQRYIITAKHTLSDQGAILSGDEAVACTEMAIMVLGDTRVAMVVICITTPISKNKIKKSLMSKKYWKSISSQPVHSE